MAARFLWKGMASDVSQWCWECLPCQRAKITTQPAAPVPTIPVPSRRFTHVHADLVGPLPVRAGGHILVMTVINRSTCWVEVFPMTSTTATACADTFIAGWIANLVCWPPSPLKEECILLQLSGLSSVNAWVYKTSLQQLTILNPTASLTASTVS